MLFFRYVKSLFRFERTSQFLKLLCFCQFAMIAARNKLVFLSLVHCNILNIIRVLIWVNLKRGIRSPRPETFGGTQDLILMTHVVRGI